MLFGEVHRAVDIQPAPAAIERYIIFDGNYWIRYSFFFIVVMQVMRKLQDHVRLCLHHPFLQGRQELAVLYFPLAVCPSVAQIEEGRPPFFHEHDAPGKAIAFFGPIEFARIKQEAERQQELKRELDIEELWDWPSQGRGLGLRLQRRRFGVG